AATAIWSAGWPVVSLAPHPVPAAADSPHPTPRPAAPRAPTVAPGRLCRCRHAARAGRIRRPPARGSPASTTPTPPQPTPRSTPAPTPDDATAQGLSSTHPRHSSGGHDDVDHQQQKPNQCASADLAPERRLGGDVLL